MPLMTHILLPVDFSRQSPGIAAYGAALARQLKSRITLLHVNPVFVPATAGLAGPADTGWVTALEAQRRRDLTECCAEAFRGLEVERVVVTGDPAAQIVQYARNQNVDLIMMPTHGYGPFRRFLIGSVAAKVLHDAECPVWTAAHLPAFAPPGGISSIVCAIDNGPASETVLRWASAFANAAGALLKIVHAVPSIEVAEGFLDPQIRQNRISAAELTLRCLQKKTAAPGLIVVGEGDPSKVVASAARDFGADLVVIGRSQHPERLKPHGYAIIRESPCPVMSV